ncbi:MAG: hypothetical protein JST00_17320 [Deltaproteobacteria bacterium]|nr:hypothetical protein [Deltaproteobacteria bacterium]
MSGQDARSLFAAARDDGPDEIARDDMFRRVALATGMAGAAAAAATTTSAAPAAAAAKATSSAIGMKLLAIGGLIGAAGTVLGVLVTLAVVEPTSGRGDRREIPIFKGQNGSSQVVGEARGRVTTIGARRADTAPRVKDPEAAKVVAVASAKAVDDAASADERSARPDASSRVSPPANPRTDVSSDLAEEARLVTEARKALVSGDAARALAMVHATRRLASRSMEPEELGLEARALRALGRTDEAAATELVLRRRFPDHALAR